MSPLLLAVFACTPSAPPQATSATQAVVTATTGDTGQYVESCTTESFDDVVPPGAPVRAVAIDDVTGQVWVAGEAGVFEVVDGVGVPQSAPGFEGGYDTEVAASAGRLVVTDGTHDPWWRDAGGTLQKAEHGRTFEGISGAGGVFFAVGAPTTYGDSYGAGAELWRHDGTGWVQLPKGPLRDYAAASAVWADSPDSAWVGLRDDQGEGAVARNDGGSWAMVLTDLEGWVSFVGASADGGLWVPQFDGPVGPSRVLMVDDGVATELAGAPDNPRGAADMSDGSVFVTAFSGGPYDTSLHKMSPDGTWSIEAQSGKLPRIAQRDADELWVLLEGRHLWHRVCP